MYSTFNKFFKKNHSAYFQFLLKKFNFKDDKIDITQLNEHLIKLDKFIFFIINFFFIYLNIISIIIFQKFFYKLSSKQKNNLLFRLNFLLIVNDKILQLFHAIICIHYFNDEKIVSSDLFKVNEEKQKSNEDFEFIVVGSGPGGSITASEILKKTKSVLIIEKGKNYEIPKTKHPGDEFLKKWNQGGMNTTVFGRQVSFSSGSCLGGGSEINSGLYHYPDFNFLKEWKDKYDTREISHEEVSFYVEETKKKLGIDFLDKEITYPESLFLNGAEKIKFKSEKIPKLISKNDSGATLKSSMSKTYLKNYFDNGGKILENYEVKKIYYSNFKWNLICEDIENKNIKIYKCKYLFICCGSIYTNQILLNSNLKKLNSKKTLKTFKFHPMFKAIACYDKKIQNQNADVHSCQVTEFYPDYILGNASSSLQFMLVNFPLNKKVYDLILNNWDKMTIFHSTLSIGSGKLIPLNFSKNSFISSYDFNSEEEKKIIKAYKDMSRLIFATGAEYMIPISENSELLNEESFEKFITKKNFIDKIKSSSVHIMGGVTMGEKTNCIADSFGKINNYNNLYVNDSSLINNNLLKNPQGTVMAIALRNIRNFMKKNY